VKPLPEIVTLVPPATGPDVGPIDAIDGGAATGVSNVKPLPIRPLWPSGFVTTTSAAPAPCAGVVAAIEVALWKATPVAATPPIDTLAPLANPVPVIVMATPPAVAPREGETAVTVGAAAAGGDGGCGDGPAGDEPPPQDIVKSASAVQTEARVVRGVRSCIGPRQ
jgi:hypothetical protein